MDLLDWNNSKEDQERGVKLAESVKCINVFLQPNSYRYGKNVWDNCAKILSARPDEELSLYLTELLKWLRDMNWPGAFCILERLKRMADDRMFFIRIQLVLNVPKHLRMRRGNLICR